MTRLTICINRNDLYGVKARISTHQSRSLPISQRRLSTSPMHQALSLSPRHTHPQTPSETVWVRLGRNVEPKTRATPHLGSVTRFSALGAAEKSKVVFKIDETSPNDAGATPPSTLEVSKQNEHVFDFSAAIKAQNRVTRKWWGL